MLSVSVIKLLFIAGGVVLCVWIAMGFKSDTKRRETADKLIQKIKSQRNQLYKNDKEK
jgi:hypothetical protein